MHKKNLAFLLAVTRNMGFAAGNVALSLRKQMPQGGYDIVVYYTDLSPGDLIAFRQIPHCRLVKFEFPASFAGEILSNLHPKSRFRTVSQLMAFAHFEAFALLSEYRNVVWIDSDTAIQGSLSEIIRFAPFGITADTPWTVQVNFADPITDYDMNAPGVCTAVMLVNESLPYEAMYKWCYAKAQEYAGNLLNADQGIVNLSLQEFHIAPNLMPLEEWQCISWKPEACVARIVHFGTEKKVWNSAKICTAFPEWYRMHLEWLRLGGADYDRTSTYPRNILSVLGA
jgi:Glycosyl transferase family 8